MRRFGLVLCALLFALLLAPAVSAQQPSNSTQQPSEWQELRTQRFAILYANNDRATADQYATFVDTIYDEIAAVFNHHTATPVTLRLYPTLERYYQSNPLARGLQGIVAHADYRRHEVVVILEQTQAQTPDEVQNNIRHELTHIVASELSEDRLNVLFQEGVAQYVELPSRELEAKISYLQGALNADRLVSWSELDDRDRFYGNAQLSYPQSLSITAFLIERYSFTKFREMITMASRSSGYRSALERTYGVSPDTLEQEWRNWLPDYLTVGYKRNAITTYDLSATEALLAQGRYADAQRELEAAIEWLRTTDQADVLAEAEQMLQWSVAGQQAEALAADVRAALETNDYARAADLVVQARQAFTTIGDARQDTVLADYENRAQRGLRAEELMQESRGLARSFRYPEARASLDQALAEYVALGDSARATQARDMRLTMDRWQTLLGFVLLAIGTIGSLASIWRRFAVREAEAW